MLMSRNVNNDVTMNPPIRTRRQMASGAGAYLHCGRSRGKAKNAVEKRKGKAAHTTSF